MSDRPGEYEDSEAYLKVTEQLWTRPLLHVIKESLPVISQGSALVAEARTGLLPMVWARKLPESLRIMALDPSRSMLDTARARLDESLQRRVFFVPQSVQALSYADGVFHSAVCINGLFTKGECSDGMRELARVVEPGGSLLVALPSKESFALCYDMLDEALKAHKLDPIAERLQQLQETFLDAADLYHIAREQGLHDLEIMEHSWQISFGSGHELFMSPLIRQTFFSHWMSIIRSTEREPIVRYMIDAVDTYFHGADIPLEVRALTLTARR